MCIIGTFWPVVNLGRFRYFENTLPFVSAPLSVDAVSMATHLLPNCVSSLLEFIRPYPNYLEPPIITNVENNRQPVKMYVN